MTAKHKRDIRRKIMRALYHNDSLQPTTPKGTVVKLPTLK